MNVFNSLKTMIVESITLNGTVKNISGGVITLTNGNTNLNVIVDAPSVPVYSYVNQKSVKAKFSDIKIGQKLGIDSRLSYANQFVGYNIYILK